MLQEVPYLDDFGSSYEKVFIRKLLKDATFPPPFFLFLPAHRYMQSFKLSQVIGKLF